ncbi:hypothetical protein FB192DRAFT_1030927 [Mucor lusitanicus]|uniref:Serine aminopeptidase S33 domain-containing protein n=1 Tax=Mucor circinelloides f. lusitanicus TaxID=29924 RepID=A0A8H4EWM6_MUCCL|nr:hypothetical protein FB192DRAFT_1030927 [Mucor lusitanicus]
MRDLMFIIVPFCFHTLPMSKLSILNEKNEAIVGILEKKPEIDEGRPQPRVVLIVHGILGHKDYLFQRVLAQTLPITSFRFDFRGNGESGGSPGYCNILIQMISTLLPSISKI